MYIYRFLGKDNKILYIGKTNCLERRLFEEHLTSQTHLDKSLYQIFEKIEYVEIPSDVDAGILEAYLISIERPIYNTEYANDKSIILDEKYYKELCWQKVDCNIEKLKKKADLYKSVFSSENTSLKIYFSALDSLLQTGTLSTLVHPCSETLTNLALNIVSKIEEGKKILYVNLKENENILVRKYLSASTNVSLKNIFNNQLNEKETKLIFMALQRMESKLFFSNISMDTFNLLNLFDEFDVIVIDDLACLESDTQYSRDKFFLTLKLLKQYALKSNKVIVVLYNLEKGNTLSLNEFPFLSIQELSDNIFTLQDKDEDKVMYFEKDFIIAKSITGVIGRFSVFYNNIQLSDIEKAE